MSRPSPEAIAAAGAIIAMARHERDTLPVAEAARRAWTPTGPSLEELCQRIAARRGETWPATADRTVHATEETRAGA